MSNYYNMNYFECYAQSYFPLNIHIELSPPLRQNFHWSKYDAMCCTRMHRHNPDKQTICP